jgi:predicted nucleic acid-binding protein
MAYLVDTNVIVDFTRGNIKAGDYLDSIRSACVLSSITALELIAGATRNVIRKGPKNL